MREHALHCTAARTSVPLRLRVLNGRGSIGCAELAAHGSTGPVFHEYETSMHGMPEAAAHASVDGGIGIAAHNDESTESCVAASRQLTLRTEYRAGYSRGWPILYLCMPCKKSFPTTSWPPAQAGACAFACDCATKVLLRYSASTSQHGAARASTIGREAHVRA